mmetsp:Transcript_104865/g.146198  ORF Transcript_104865/g.146198 Transcript_104865/m.146198 type:complete len:133 (-) Transcript_104865:289-687(-)
MKYAVALVLAMCVVNASAWGWWGRSSSSGDSSPAASVDDGDSGFNPPNYRQCSSEWGQTALGFGSKTICRAGCLMTSVADALAGHGATINGQTVTPALFNNWLKDNNGFYNHGNLLLWGAAQSLGLKFDGFV